MKETEVAEPVRDWLLREGWEVYCEVAGRGGRADLVAVQGPILWVVEAKVRLSWGVLMQAKGWIRYAHRVSVAVPWGWSAERRFAHEVCRDYGIGVFAVEKPDQWNRRPVHVPVDPPFRRRVDDQALRSCLYEEQKQSTPSAASAGWVTPFSITVQHLTAFVRDNPGCTVTEAVEGIRHHWEIDSYAKANVRRYIRSRIIQGIILDDSEKPHRLYLEVGPQEATA